MKRKSQFSWFVPGSLIFLRFENRTIKEYTYESGETTFEVQTGPWIYKLDDLQMEVKLNEHKWAVLEA